MKMLKQQTGHSIFTSGIPSINSSLQRGINFNFLTGWLTCTFFLSVSLPVCCTVSFFIFFNCPLTLLSFAPPPKSWPLESNVPKSPKVGFKTNCVVPEDFTEHSWNKFKFKIKILTLVKIIVREICKDIYNIDLG